MYSGSGSAANSSLLLAPSPLPSSAPDSSYAATAKRYVSLVRSPSTVMGWSRET